MLLRDGRFWQPGLKSTCAAFLTELPHRVRPSRFGFRLVLTYRLLCAEAPCGATSAPIAQSVDDAESKAIGESADDLETATELTKARIRVQMLEEEKRVNQGKSEECLPRSAVEWVQAIGLGRYENSFRAHGINRIELAARITPDDCKRLGISAGDADKLVSSAQRLSTRLAKSGRMGYSTAPLDQSGYEAASAIHYDEDAGVWWGEDGSMEAGSSDVMPYSRPPSSSGVNLKSVSSDAHARGEHEPQNKQSIARQRDRKGQSKARIGNHNRKNQAARKAMR